MVADLARWLRILGEDCRWASPDWSDAQVLQVAHDEGRVVVTRDDGLVRRAAGHAVVALRVPQAGAERALLEVYRGLGLRPSMELLATRCAMCNGRLVSVDAPQAARAARQAGKEPPLEEVQARHERFWSCTACGQAYWRGTHWQEIERVRQGLLAALDDG